MLNAVIMDRIYEICPRVFRFQLDYAHVHIVLANEILTDALLPPDLMPAGQ
jgi:hypothetical protein